jgi:hypothetical protein
MAEKQVKAGQKSEQQTSRQEPAKDKTGKKSSVAIIVSVLLIAIIAALAVLTVTKNLFGGRDGMLNWLASLDPAYENSRRAGAGLNAQAEELTSREESLTKRRSRADRRGGGSGRKTERRGRRKSAALLSSISPVFPKKNHPVSEAGSDILPNGGPGGGRGALRSRR